MHDWRVHVDWQPIRRQCKIYLYRRCGPDETEVVQQGGRVVRVATAELLPDDAGIAIPADAWDALVEHAAGQSHAGAVNGVLREWLKTESARVDVALGRRPGG